MEPLPLEVRARVVALASDRLGMLAADAVPVSLKSVQRFTPSKRAKLGAAALAAALESEPVFRQSVAELAKERFPETALALKAGTPPDASVEELAALGYLTRAPGWEELVEKAREELAARHAGRSGAAELDAVTRLTEQLEAVRAHGREALAAARAQAEASEQDLAVVRKKVREIGDRAGRAEAAQRVAEAKLAEAHADLEELRSGRAAELRTVQDQLTDAQHAVVEAKKAAREGRQDDQLRLRLLLDALMGAAQGLRRELALPPVDGRPADAISGDYAVPAAGPSLQGRSAEDPTLLDALLNVPLTHLIIDGYNVTKTAYGALPLESQRARLLGGLGALAARTSAEVTVVFDGADGSVAVAVPAPRGVRLLFSRTGETADEVIRRLARHEPEGRPVVVVSSDKEVIDGVVRTGARAVPSIALARLLDRGSV